MTDLITLDPRLSDTAPPGLLARREWAGSHVRSHVSVALTAAKIVLVPLGQTEPTEVFIASMQEVTLDLTANTVTLAIRDTTDLLSIQFYDTATTDDFFSRLARRAGTDYSLTTDRPTPLELARSPLGVMAGILLATATLAVTVAGLPDVLANTPNPPAWLSMLGRLDWRVVAGAGGMALAAAQVWLYRLLKHPPARLFLARTR